MSRRREDRVVSCLLCGDVLAIYEEGDRVRCTPHACAEHDALDRDIESQLDQLRGKA